MAGNVGTEIKLNNKFEVLTDEGWKDFSGISIKKLENLITIKTENFEIECTTDHRIFFEKNRCKPAEKFEVGESILTESGFDKIISIDIYSKEENVFDLLNVKDTSSYICNGIKIHNCLVVDERAFIPNNVWDAFISSVYPTISSVNTSKVIYVSTPNGLNHFYKDWMDSIEGKNEFNHIRVDWWQVPDRDEKWKLETIANIGMLRFAQEYGNDFLGSSDTLIPKTALVAMKHKNKYVELPEKLTKIIQEKYYNYINLYEEPKEEHIYSMGIDSSKMTEESKGDALAIQILDITQLPYKQVASFHARSGMNYLMIPPIAAAIGNYYNGAYAFVENNEIGQEVANNLNYDYEYENTFFEKNALPGFRTTKKTKYVGYTNLETLIANEKLIINDFETIHELSTFVRKKDSYKADKGYKDDLVMAMLAALYFMQRKEYDAFDDSKHMLERISEIVEKPMSDEDLPMFGIIDDVSEELSAFD